VHSLLSLCSLWCVRCALYRLLGSADVFYALPGSELFDCLISVMDWQHCQSGSLSGFPPNMTSLGPSYTYEGPNDWYGGG
jgi:hypothetical protein